ncbi:hypothetical protein PRIPAC_77607 [Pristionchus pacificus]|uniref:Uncharacterized protein n=1 Tax=Pristionchus pacificus TaxID=54126 RepID=A0A2A6BHL4_PRIPA|nr:hypothetical protein PRIPAC_77607 [Pristionchus pacificus]|eukprot:PDM65379.1 hypothetical protein PRIPAC_52321 [Pristionchus pacificus]
MKTFLIFLVVACVSVATPMDEDPVSTRMLFCHNLTLTYIFDKPSLTLEDQKVLGICMSDYRTFFLRKFGMNYKDLDEFEANFERDLPELLEGLNDAARAFFKRIQGTQSLKDLVDFNQYLYRHSLPTFDKSFVYIRDIVAYVGIASSYEKSVLTRMLCHYLAFTRYYIIFQYFFARSELTYEETSFTEWFGINYKDLNEFKDRFERDRPEMIDALADALGAFYVRIKGTQTLKDLGDLNTYLGNHGLPTYDDLRNIIGSL